MVVGKNPPAIRNELFSSLEAEHEFAEGWTVVGRARPAIDGLV